MVGVFEAGVLGVCEIGGPVVGARGLAGWWDGFEGNASLPEGELDAGVGDGGGAEVEDGEGGCGEEVDGVETVAVGGGPGEARLVVLFAEG